MKTIVKFDIPLPATMLRWGTHPVPDCPMPPGEYVRLAPRTWAAWLGNDHSVKYIYRITK